MKTEEATQSKKFITIAKETDNKNSNSSELIKREELKDTPFVIITIEDKECFGTLGKYRITEVYKTPEEVKAELEPITWNRIVQVFSILTEVLTNKE